MQQKRPSFLSKFQGKINLVTKHGDITHSNFPDLHRHDKTSHTFENHNQYKTRNSGTQQERSNIRRASKLSRIQNSTNDSFKKYVNQQHNTKSFHMNKMEELNQSKLSKKTMHKENLMKIGRKAVEGESPKFANRKNIREYPLEDSFLRGNRQAQIFYQELDSLVSTNYSNSGKNTYTAPTQMQGRKMYTPQLRHKFSTANQNTPKFPHIHL